MISEDIIKTITDRLVQVYNPRILYIFGSHAWGNPGDASDLDILIIVDSSVEKFHRRSIPGYNALKGIKVSKDILILTVKEFDEMSLEPSSLYYTVKKFGIKLYEAA